MKFSITLLLFFAVAIVVLPSCSRNANFDMAEQTEGSMGSRVIESVPSSRQAVPGMERAYDASNSSVEEKIQINGTLSIEVKELDEAMVEVKNLIIRYDAKIVRSFSAKAKQPYIDVNLLIPSLSFDALLGEIKEISSSIMAETIYSNDVTEEYIDIEARLIVMKSTEERFLLLLAEAKDIGEIIQVEKELMRLRGQIDSLEGRRNYLTQTTQNAELHLHMVEQMPISGAGWSFSKSFSDALRNFNSSMKLAAGWLINIAVFSPLFLLLLLAFFLTRRFLKKRKTPNS